MISARKKTLVVLTPGFPASEEDTTCLPFLQTHILALKKQDPTVEICVLTFQYPHFKGWYKWYETDVKSFGGRGGAKLKRVLLWTKVWTELRKLKHEKNVIGLFSLWCTECALVGHYFGHRYNIKHRTWLCGQDAKANNRYIKYIRPTAEELVAMSDFLRREFARNYSVIPAHTIPLGVNTIGLQDNDNREIDLLGVGSLIPLKQYDVFVETVNDLAISMPGIKAQLCGDGPEKGNLTRSIEANNLDDNIVLKGEIPHSEVLRKMERTRIFVHTSCYEGFGTVCLEALHAGAHVVSFTKPMDSDIDHWHHVKDKDEMVNKIRELLTKENLDHAPVVPFTTDAVGAQLLALFS